MVALSWCVFEFYLGVIWECLGKQILTLLSLFTVVALFCMSTIFAVAAAAVQRADLGSPFAGEKCLLCGMKSFVSFFIFARPCSESVVMPGPLARVCGLYCRWRYVLVVDPLKYSILCGT